MSTEDQPSSGYHVQYELIGSEANPASSADEATALRQQQQVGLVHQRSTANSKQTQQACLLQDTIERLTGKLARKRSKLHEQRGTADDLRDIVAELREADTARAADVQAAEVGVACATAGGFG